MCFPEDRPEEEHVTPAWLKPGAPVRSLPRHCPSRLSLRPLCAQAGVCAAQMVQMVGAAGTSEGSLIVERMPIAYDGYTCEWLPFSLRSMLQHRLLRMLRCRLLRMLFRHRLLRCCPAPPLLLLISSLCSGAGCSGPAPPAPDASASLLTSSCLERRRTRSHRLHRRGGPEAGRNRAPQLRWSEAVRHRPVLLPRAMRLRGDVRGPLQGRGGLHL